MYLFTKRKTLTGTMFQNSKPIKNEISTNVLKDLVYIKILYIHVPLFTRPLTICLMLSCCSRHHRAKNAISTQMKRLLGSLTSSGMTESSTYCTPAFWMSLRAGNKNIHYVCVNNALWVQLKNTGPYSHSQLECEYMYNKIFAEKSPAASKAEMNIDKII